MYKTTLRLYNQTSLGVFETPVLSEHALALLKHYIGDFEALPELGYLKLVAPTIDDGGYDTGDIGRVLLGAALPEHHADTLGEKPLLLDVLQHLTMLDGRWLNCLTAIECHCVVDDDSTFDTVDASELYVSMYILMELLLHDPDSCITAVQGNSAVEDDSVGDFYMSKHVHVFNTEHYSHQLGGQLNTALVDNNVTQVATVLMTHVRDVLVGISNVELAAEVHRQLAAMLMDTAPALSIDTYSHQVGTDGADPSIAIDLSQL
jgi:hypothetical protein